MTCRWAVAWRISTFPGPFRDQIFDQRIQPNQETAIWDDFIGECSRAHAKGTGKDISFFDETTKNRYVPHVIEPAAGCDRTAMTFLVDAYDEETMTNDKGKEETRVVLRFHPKIAPNDYVASCRRCVPLVAMPEASLLEIYDSILREPLQIAPSVASLQVPRVVYVDNEIFVSSRAGALGTPAGKRPR